MKKLMKHLTNNIGLKLLSLLFSIALWMVVVNVADPDGTKNFSIPVTIQNKNVIEQMGKVPDIVGDSDIALFYITGPRSYVEAMDPDDFNVTADLSQVDLTGEDETKLVRIQITPKKYEKYITVHQKTVNMQIKLEELAEKNFVISPITAGTPAEGCAIGEVEVTPNLLAISGPQSVVSKISKVTATINVDGISSDVTDSVAPVLYDEDGNVISTELLETNQSMVNIKANILETKKLSIQCGVTGEPAEGYEYTGLEYAPQTITVKGEAGILNTINVISIPESVMDISGATADVVNTVYITEYLPEGVSLVDDEANQIAVKALIVQKASKVFNLPTENIKISGLRERYELTYGNTILPVTIRALSENMDGFDVKSIQAAIDVADLEPGIHVVQLEITMNDDRYEVAGSVSVQVTIKDKEAENRDDSGNTETGSGGSTDNTSGNKPESGGNNDDSNNSINGRE